MVGTADCLGQKYFHRRALVTQILGLIQINWHLLSSLFQFICIYFSSAIMPCAVSCPVWSRASAWKKTVNLIDLVLWSTLHVLPGVQMEVHGYQFRSLVNVLTSNKPLLIEKGFESLFCLLSGKPWVRQNRFNDWIPLVYTKTRTLRMTAIIENSSLLLLCDLGINFRLYVSLYS